jgi:hypothetical protein
MALTDGLLVDWQRLWMTQISWGGRVMRSICARLARLPALVGDRRVIETLLISTRSNERA